MRELLKMAAMVALAGCGGKATQAGSVSSDGNAPELTPVVECAAWINKMPGFVERDAEGKPIYPGHFLVKVHGDAPVVRLLVKGAKKDVGEFGPDDLVKRDMGNWIEFLVDKEIRLDEGDTLSAEVWLVLSESDTASSLIQNIPVKTVY